MKKTTIEETKKRHQEEYNTLVEFLKRTKDGKYASIEKTSVSYIRLKVETEVVESNEEEYYYSLRWSKWPLLTIGYLALAIAFTHIQPSAGFQILVKHCVTLRPSVDVLVLRSFRERAKTFKYVYVYVNNDI